MGQEVTPAALGKSFQGWPLGPFDLLLIWWTAALPEEFQAPLPLLFWAEMHQRDFTHRTTSARDSEFWVQGVFFVACGIQFSDQRLNPDPCSGSMAS